jgi:hypothetical protein
MNFVHVQAKIKCLIIGNAEKLIWAVFLEFEYDWLLYYKIRELVGLMESTAYKTKQLYNRVMQLTIAEQLSFS